MVLLAHQGGLFEPPPGGGEVPLPLDGVRRTELDARSWIDRVEHWVPDHAALFDQLLEAAPWRQRERRMYDRSVLEPRLVAGWSGEAVARLPDRLAQVRRALGTHYGLDFDSVLVNLYRDGRDGVAWHGDTVRRHLDAAVVVTVALGERRPFLLRRGTSGPAELRLQSGEGDLVVMGGRCQHEWQHTVPKQVGAGARMSVTMRHSTPAP